MVRIVSLPPPAVLHTPKPPISLSSHTRPDPSLARPDSWDCQARPSCFVVPSSSGRECPLPPLPKSLGLRNFHDLYPEPDSPCTPHDSLESLLRDSPPPSVEKYDLAWALEDDCGGAGGGHLQLHLSGSDFMRPFTPSFLFSTMFSKDSPEGCVFRESPLENIEDSVDEGSLVADNGFSESDDGESDIISSSCTLLGDGWRQRWGAEGGWTEETEYPVLYWGQDEEDIHREEPSTRATARGFPGGGPLCAGRLEDASKERKIRTHSSQRDQSCLSSLLCFC